MRNINQQKLERELKEMCQSWDFSGFFIVNQCDECLVESGFGYADRMVPNGLEQRAIKSDSRFIFHSESPLLVAIAVLQLVDEKDQTDGFLEPLDSRIPVCRPNKSKAFA